MQTQSIRNVRSLLAAGVLVGATLGALAGSAPAPRSGLDCFRGVKTWMTMQAGTVFNLSAVDDQGNYLPYPWHHQVRGIAQVSHLGNCKVFFDVVINAGEQGHLFRLGGKLFVTTLAGDKLEADLTGWADPDPKDPKAAPTMYRLHYDVRIVSGSGKLAGALGCGDIDGAFMFSGPDGPEDTDATDDRFCDGYAGVATWTYEGVLTLPRAHRR